MTPIEMTPIKTLNHPAIACADKRVRRAMAFLIDNSHAQPCLDQVAAHVGLSSFYFQKLFSKETGISPKLFLKSLTLTQAKKLLRATTSTLETSLAVGLSSPSRLHDLFITYEAMTPGEYKKGGQGLTIRYQVFDTLFGEVVALLTERGLCGFDFVTTTPQALIDRAHRQWPAADLRAGPTVDFAPLRQALAGTAGSKPLNLLLAGTAFQLAVWQALLEVPYGTTSTYQAIARRLGNPKASRATGQAIGRNPLALLVPPCHRILRTCGSLGGYASGTGRKRALLEWESLS